MEGYGIKAVNKDRRPAAFRPEGAFASGVLQQAVRTLRSLQVIARIDKPLLRQPDLPHQTSKRPHSAPEK